MKTMTQVLQLKFQCDADLGGNQDNGHSQTSYIGYLGESVICWCSTDQGSVSTSAFSVRLTALISDSAVEVETLPWSVEHQQMTDSPRYPMYEVCEWPLS